MCVRANPATFLSTTKGETSEIDGATKSAPIVGVTHGFAIASARGDESPRYPTKPADAG
jgi:hypothetical protein